MAAYGAWKSEEDFKESMAMLSNYVDSLHKESDSFLEEVDQEMSHEQIDQLILNAQMETATVVITPEVFDTLNYKPYRQKSVKHAVIVWEPATYHVWDVISFDGPHVLVNGEYGVEFEEFFTTHVPAKEPNTYRKAAVVDAVQLLMPARISTKVKDNTETDSVVPAGFWLVRNPSGVIYYNTEEEFSAYEPV